jgi:hypothetical protein
MVITTPTRFPIAWSPPTRGNLNRRSGTTKPPPVGRRRGEFAGRNRSERRFSSVISTSDQANSAGAFPGASLSLGDEACCGPEYSERDSGTPGRCTGRRHAKAAHQHNRETLFGPAEATPSGREAYKGETRKRSNDAEQGVGGGPSGRSRGGGGSRPGSGAAIGGCWSRPGDPGGRRIRRGREPSTGRFESGSRRSVIRPPESTTGTRA